MIATAFDEENDEGLAVANGSGESKCTCKKSKCLML